MADATDPLRVWLRFVRLHRRAAGAVAAELRAIGLSIPQFDLLSTLTEQEGLSQQELAARVRSGKAANYAVRLVDAFEERWGGPTYFQAYEFVEHGGDLQQILDAEREQHAATGRAPTMNSAR